jgi:CheY-like chemotaxis protein
VEKTALCVLLAEDNPNDVRVFNNALSAREDRAQFKPYFVRDGGAVLDFLSKSDGFESAEHPDLVVLNLNMPVLNGMEVLRHMKDDPDLRGIPAVIWTISEREEDIRRSFDLGAQGYFVKPIDVPEMEAQVNAILTWLRWAYLNIYVKPRL